MYKLHEKCYKSVISPADSVCSSYMGLYLTTFWWKSTSTCKNYLLYALRFLQSIFDFLVTIDGVLLCVSS